MVDFATLVFGAETRGLLRGVDALDRVVTHGERAEFAVENMSAAIGRAGRSLAGYAAAYLSVSKLSQAAQTYTGISNGFKAMGETSAGAAKQIQALADIANRTRTPLEATADLYRKISVAGKELGANQQSIARFTENVGLALAASGGNAQSAEGALLQLSQAMAGGVVRAEEFNSILEGAYPIAMAAAAGIDEAGGSVGRLRKMVVEGEVSSREFFDAILSQSDALEAAFANTLPTISQATTVLGNNFTMLVGQIDSTTGASAAVANAILAVANGMSYLTENMDTVMMVLERGVSVGAAFAAMYAGRVAVSMGVTFVQAATSAVRSTVALEMALGASSRSAALASASVKALSGGLRILRGAIISTGIGALVVGAGELIYQFSRLVDATGGWGNALSLLGDVASGVWDGIKTSAQSIPVALGGIWDLVHAGFVNMVASIQRTWGNALATIAGGFAGVKGGEEIAAQLSGKSIEVLAEVSALDVKVKNLKDSAVAAKDEAIGLATQGFGKAREAAAKLSAAVATNNEETEDGTTAAERLNEATSSLADANEDGAKAAKKAADAQKKLREEIERLELDADPVKKYNEQLKHLKELQQAGLSDRAAEYAIRGFNDELANSLPMVTDVTSAFRDWMEGGLKDFKGFGRSLLDILKSTIYDMIAMVARNRIVIPIAASLSGTSAISGASSAISSLGGSGLSGLSGITSLTGGLTSTIDSLSSAISGVTGGLGVVGAALGNFATGTLASISGFLSGGFSGLTGTVSAIAANGGLSTLLGATLGPVGLIAGAAGLMGAFNRPQKTFNIEERGLELFGYSQNNLTWARSVARGNDGYDGNVVSKKNLTLDGFDKAMMEAQNQLFTMVSQFGLDTAGVIDAALAEAATRDKGWLLRREINLDGLSDDEKTAEILNFIADATGELASFVPGLEAVTREGENGYEALIAMQEALALVNSTSESLGSTLIELSLAGGDAARSLLEAFGSADAYSSAVSNYVSLFYSDAEQLEFALGSLTQAMESLGVAMPATREQYMAMIDAADLTTESGRTLYTALVSLASQFDAVLPSVESFSAAMAEMSGVIVTGVESMISDANDSAQAAARAAADWYAASVTLRDFIQDLNASQGGQAGLAALTSQMNATYQAALGGDIDAARDFPSIAAAYLDATRDQSATQLDYLRAQADIAARANMLAGVSELEGASKSVQEVLYEQQVSLLQELQDTLESGSEVTSDQLSALNDQLSNIDAAITEAQGLTYANLMKRLQVAVDLIPSADIPEDLARLMSQAASGIESEIIFAVTSPDLTPDLRWLAITGASEHLKTLDFVIGADISDRNKKLALQTVSDLSKTVNFVAGSSLTHDQMAVALAGNSELSRTVNATLASGASNRAIRLALGETRSYGVEIQASINAPRQVRNLLDLAGVQTGRVTLGGAFNFNPSNAFSDWYERQTKAKIKDPMDALRSSIDLLADTIVYERQLAEAKEAAAASSYARSSALATAQGLVDTIKALEASTGVTLKNGGRDATLNANNYAATWREYVSGSSDYAAFTAAFDGPNGLQAQLIAAQAALKAAKADDRTAQKVLSSLLDAPGYATGTSGFGGGLRIVGENGPELEATGPSRIWNANQTRNMMGGNSAEVVAVLRQVLAENRAMRARLEKMQGDMERVRQSTGVTAETSKRQRIALDEAAVAAQAETTS